MWDTTLSTYVEALQFDRHALHRTKTALTIYYQSGHTDISILPPYQEQTVGIHVPTVVPQRMPSSFHGNGKRVVFLERP